MKAVKSLLPRSDLGVWVEMAATVTAVSNVHQKKPTGDCEDVDKMLMVIVKRRKTIPTKCMEINKEISTYELQRLQNAKVDTEEDDGKEKFRKIIQGFKRLKSLNYTLDDMNEAEQKLEKYCKRTKEINNYLEKRRKF